MSRGLNLNRGSNSLNSASGFNNRDYTIWVCDKCSEVRTFVLCWSPSFTNLRINLIPLRYPVMFISYRYNLNWLIKHWSSNLKVPTLDVDIKCLRLTISTQKKLLNLINALNTAISIKVTATVSPQSDIQVLGISRIFGVF